MTGLFGLLLLLISLGIGVSVERFLLRYLRELVRRTGWKWDDVLFSSLRKVTTIWFLVIGLYMALPSFPLSPSYLSLIKKGTISLAIISVTVFFARLITGLLRVHLEKLRDVLPPTSLFENLTKLAVFVIGGLILVQTLGISITPALAGLGIGGLAVALALQGPLANLFSGIHIMISRQLKPGDYVKLETGEEGYVVDITWRNTAIRQLPNNLVIVPNSKLASLIVTNYHQPQPELAVLVQVGVSYSSDLEKVERVTVEVAKEVMREVPGGVPDFEPFIRYHTFSDFSINFTVILRAKEYVDQYLIKHEFIKRLHKRYREEGIEIPFPIRTVYLHTE